MSIPVNRIKRSLNGHPFLLHALLLSTLWDASKGKSWGNPTYTKSVGLPASGSALSICLTTASIIPSQPLGIMGAAVQQVGRAAGPRKAGRSQILLPSIPLLYRRTGTQPCSSILRSSRLRFLGPRSPIEAPASGRLNLAPPLLPASDKARAFVQVWMDQSCIWAKHPPPTC